MTSDRAAWQPGTSLELLQQRARMLQRLRAFFAKRQVLEVETPIVQRHTVTDPHIPSLGVDLAPHGGYLHTSPEYAMKRLLAAGSGAIYQVCKVFRAGEAGRQHNPEFTLLEWYRPGFNLQALMGEVEALVRELLQETLTLGETRYFSYRQLFQDYLHCDPFTLSIEELQQLARTQAIEIGAEAELDLDAWRDLLLTHVIEPQLPRDCPVFVYDYPASQAALARLHHDGDEMVASRFELYINGLELANGYHELLDPIEQRRRFEKDQARRRQQGQVVPELDEKFLAALEHGLPDCSGVALGLDRLLMLASGKDDIRDVLSFSTDHL